MNMSPWKITKSRFASLVLAFALLALPFACKEDDPESPNAYVNNWIYDNMEFWYYWNSTLPSDPDRSLDHEPFFESLLNTQDRFSWIQDNFEELLNSLQGVSKEAGYEFVLYRETEGSNNVIAQILYIKPNSPAEIAGLKRGDIVSHINSQQITVDNYQTLLSSLGETHSITYKTLEISNQTFGESQTLSLTPVEYAENPNFLHKVFTYDDRKIGYYVYNLFSTGPSSTSSTYTNEQDQIFSSFQSEGISDLIIDLRFNSGGAESATKNLASLIGKGINSSKIFSKREYNELVTTEILNDSALGEEFLRVMFLDKSQNIGSLLRDSRVYILTGSRTASASELLINGLRPYMDVFLIGNVTVGKNVGSISLFEEDDPNNTWGMQPIVTKSFNSLDQSDYDNGFTPQVLDEDNSVYIYPLGDPNERLLNRALREITGLPEIGRAKEFPEKTFGQEVGHSLDLKKRSNVLVIEGFK